MKKSIIVERINKLSKEQFEKKYKNEIFRFICFDWGTFIYESRYWGYTICVRFTLNKRSDYRGLEYFNETSLCAINLFNSDYVFEAVED